LELVVAGEGQIELVQLEVTIDNIKVIDKVGLRESEWLIKHATAEFENIVLKSGVLNYDIAFKTVQV
jgi:hypothetical protein